MPTSISKKWLLFFLSGILICHQGFAQNPDHFIIGTGKRFGNYYKAGEFIAHAYNKAFPGKRFVFIETNGSNENIQMLRERSLDFGIVQRNVLINNIYARQKGTKNLAVIVPLFREELQVYYRGNKNVSLDSIAYINNGKSWKVGVTSKKGFSFHLFKTLLQFLNVDMSNMQVVVGNYNQLYDSLTNKKVDVVVSFSLPVEKFEKIPEIRKIYLKHSSALLLQNRINNLFIRQQAPGKYTLGTWSFLVANKRSLEKLGNSEKLISALTNTTQSNPFAKIIQESVQTFTNNKNSEQKKLRKIPLSEPFKKKMNTHGFYSSLILVFALVLGVLAIYARFVRNRIISPENSLLYYWQRFKHFVYGFLALVLIFFVSVELLYHYEKLFYDETGKMSPLLNLTRNDLYSWIIITTTTGNSEGIFPYSLAGKIMLALNSMNFWIGTILIGSAELVAIRSNKKRKLGLMKTKHSNHVVIFGWNSSAENLIIDLLDNAHYFNQKNFHIVAVVPDTQKIRNEYSKIRYLHDIKRIDLITGDALDFHILEMAHTHLADTVILLADGNSNHADERTVMRAFAISRFTKMKKHKGNLYKTNVIKRTHNKIKHLFATNRSSSANFKQYEVHQNSDSIYMIAEINDPQFKESLIDAEVNEIMISGNYRRAIIKQSVFNHGISQVIDEIVNYNEYNEFYKIDLSLEANAKLRGKTFDELLVALRKVGILLVGIHIIFHDTQGNIIIDRQIIQQLLREYENGLSRDIIINPTDPKELSRPVDEDDHLIVLARNFKQIEEGIRKLRFN